MTLIEELPPTLQALNVTWTEPPASFPGRDAGATGAPLLGNGDMAACLGGPADDLKLFINRNDFWRLDNSVQGKQKVAAVLGLKLPRMAGAAYRLDQAVWNGALRGAFSKDGLTVKLAAWLAATEDLLVLELSAEGGEAPVGLALAAPGEPPSEVVTGSAGDTAWCVRRFARQVEIPTEAATVVRVIGAAGSSFTLQPGKPVTLIIATASAFGGPQPLDAARARAAAVALEEVARVRRHHDAWWAQYWKRAGVELHDEDLMRGYYQGLYTLAACSRNPRFPPGLFGTWITTDNPNWSNDYHLNYNFVAAFYGLYSANRVEQADPQDAPLIAFMPRGRWYAENVTKTRGVLYPVGIGPMGMEVTRGETWGRELGSSEQGGLFHHQRSNAAYSLVNIAQRWRCTYDPEYGKKVYPFVLAVIDFWEDYLKLVDGKYHIHGDAIHELTGPNKDPILTLGLLRNAFDLAIDLSEALGADEARRAAWRKILANLADFPTQERGGKIVFRYTAEGPTWVDGNTLGIQHIYPGNGVTLDSDPALLEIARNTIAAMGRWQDGNGSNSFFPAAVRVGVSPETVLEQLRVYVRDMYPNGFRRGNVHGVENCSTVHNTINEMLCMSVGHVLRLFPAWPRNRDASFTDLRAWGAFRVSAELKGGAIGGVRIVSERGRDCVVQNPWPGKSVEVTWNGKEAEPRSGERFAVKTRAGDVIRLEPR